MSDLQKYIKDRKAKDPEFAKDYDIGYEQFKIGVLLKQERERVGLTQEQLAGKLHTKKTAISRIENHAEDKVVLAKYGVFRVSDYKAKMLTCTQCKHILLFEAGNTFFLGVD